MNLKEVKEAVTHLRQTCNCIECKGKFKNANIHIIATVGREGLFEMRCLKCKTSTIVTISMAPEISIRDKNTRTHKGISDNDVLDIKNFLAEFNGNFKDVFDKKI